MATLEDLKLLFQNKQPNPWSSLLQGQSVPEDQNASFDPNIGNGSMQLPQAQSDMATPPMVQPDFSGESGSVSGASTSMNPEMLKIYKQMMDKSNESIGNQKDYLEKLKGYSDKVRNTKLDPDFTALMMGSDAWNGTHFQNQYKKPMDEMQRDQLANQADLAVQNQLGNISKEELNMMKTQLGGLMQSERYKEAGNQKISEQDEKDRDKIMKIMDVDKTSGRTGAVGKAQMNVNQAQRIKALIDQYKDDPNKMPLTGPASVSELAIGLNSLLSSTGGSEESRKSLIPQSAKGKFSTLKQYFSNTPEPSEMGDFIQAAKDTLKREAETNQGQVDQYHQRINAALGDSRYSKRHPEEFKKLVGFYLNSDGGAAAPAGDAEAEKEAIYKKFPNLRPK